jgi:hypothetical protein
MSRPKIIAGWRNRAKTIPTFPGSPVVRRGQHLKVGKVGNVLAAASGNGATSNLSLTLPHMRRSGNDGNDGNVFAAAGEDGAISLGRMDGREPNETGNSDGGRWSC